MEKLNRDKKTILAVIGFFVCAILGSLYFWQPLWHQERMKAEESSAVIESSQELLSKKQALESEWSLKKASFKETASQEDVLNRWMKDILAFAQTQSLKIDKLEPAGTRQDNGRKEPLLFLSFQADIKQWSSFLYYLLESDPLAKVESFSLRQEEDSRHLSIELILRKIIL